ncbi:TonB-dependent receptor [Rhabdobacter roseus]|uniref:TonB-linked SusC/RagA family outer membrane protein n=1 Tax=Rhabdobacter roseus TaxID=1655419 RepID=A0A840TWM8_9BACT|nr:TonB-dependent receptor [Rhabdobacter roseus]MBB5284049.1 TonB-linked SusC/RagA family outer membrane protein [Rhabdobacter roseus]
MLHFLIKIPGKYLLLLGLFVSSAYAQTPGNLTISGIVTGRADGQPLAGATVVVGSTTQGTTTDANGRYTLSAPAEGTLTVSFIGYLAQNVPINRRTEINVALAADPNELSEVVVVGYGTQRRRDLTGSIVSVSAEAIKEMPITSAEQALQGRLSGVQVIQGNSSPGGSLSIRVRGGNSVRGGSEPLYVIDGFPVYNNIGTNDGQSQPINPMSAINPNDITSIEVLKDASATAIYGSRGANGVVIITTRRGQVGAGRVEFEAYYGQQTVRRKIPMLNAQEYMELTNERARNIGGNVPYPDFSRWTADTDWQDAIFRPAPISNYTLTFSGGSESSRYSISGNWFDQQGIVEGSSFQRGSVRLNLDNQLSSKLSLSTNITASRAMTDQARTSINFTNGIVYSALVAPPVAPITNPDGSYFNIGTVPTADPAWNNPVVLAEGFSNGLVANRFLGNTNLTYSILPDLTFSVRLGLDYTVNRRDRYLSRLLPGSTGNATITGSDNSTYLNENILSYRKQFNNHSLNAVGGFTWQETMASSFSANSQNFALDIFGTDNLGAGSTLGAPTSSRSLNTLLSWLGRVNYVFNDKYLLTVSARADGSSRFGTGNKWGFFPSAALAWRLSEEAFLKQVDWLSELKVRTSVGVTGNQEIGNYNSLARLGSVAAIFGANQGRVIGYAQTSMPNANLKWETTAQYDAGLDIGLWSGRVNVNLDYYVKNTTDLLTSVPVAISSGYASILFNSGSIRNQGFEVAVDATVLNKERLRWNMGVNFSTNKNEVVSVAVEGGQFFAPNISSPVDLPVNVVREGEPLAAFYGYVSDGLWETNQAAGSIMPNAKAGDLRYKDLNGDGVINTADRTILGKPNPDFIYGITSQLTFGPFDLNVLLQGLEGATVFNANKYSIGDAFARNANQLAEVKDRWTPENPNLNAKYPRLSNVNPLVSDRFFEDASYFRLRNIQLGYTLPTSIKWFRSARVYVSGQNLLTWTSYTGYDPEVDSVGGGDLRQGVDVGAYPSAKTITFGVKFGF